MTDTPSVGRIVHYRSSTADECMAAMITWVREDVVNLNVFYFNGGQAPRFSVRQGRETGQWHWPERTGGPIDGAKVILIGER